MTTKKQPDRILWRLLSASVAFLTLMIGCTGPTAEISATNTPTIAAATATPAAATATATAAPPTETATPTSIPAAMEITEDSDLFINLFEALKAKYVIGNDAEFAQLPEFIEVPDGHQIWVSQGTITDKESMTIYSTGSIVIFSASGEALVFKNNIDFEKVEDPGLGYTMSLKTDENGNPIIDPFNDDSLTLRAIFLGDPNEPVLIWSPESGAWEERLEGHEAVFEAMMTGTKEMWNGGTEIPGLSFKIVESSWKEYEELINFTPPDQLVLPEGFDPNADRKVVREFISNNFETIVAMDPITKEIIEIQALDDDGQLQIDIVVISDIGEGVPYYWELGENMDGADRVYLPGYMQYNELTKQSGRVFGIYFFPATEIQKAKVVVYMVENYHIFDNGDERRKMSSFVACLASPIGLLAAPSEEMQQRVFSVPEGARNNNPTIGVSKTIILREALHEITETTTVWKY